MADGGRIANFSEAGCGKTLTAIEARRRVDPARTLIVVPSIAVPQWRDEMVEQNEAKDIVTVRAGSDLSTPQQGTIITTWRLATMLADELTAWGPSCVVMDESRALVSPASQRTKALLGRFCDGRGVIEKADHVWPMTGTPIIAWPDGLWPTMAALWPEKLARKGVEDYWSFKNRYCRMQKKVIRVRGGMRREITEIVGGQNEGELQEMLYGDSRVATRRLLTEVDQHLPPRRERQIEVRLNDQTALDHMTAGMSDAEIDELLVSNSPAAKSVRQAFGVAKIPGIFEYLGTTDEPVLVLTWHRHVAESLAELLPNARLIQGGTSAGSREKTLDDFNAGQVQFLVGQIGAMGTAINLQKACKRVVVAERIGSPAMMEQALRRVWRRGQDQTVQVDILRASHRLERRTDAVLATKSETQTLAIDGEAA
jgi:superfamily II DNA or RNA helicase